MMHWFKQQARAFIAFNYNSTVCIFYSRTRHDGLYFYKTACSGGLWECFFLHDVKQNDVSWWSNVMFVYGNEWTDLRPCARSPAAVGLGLRLRQRVQQGLRDQALGRLAPAQPVLRPLRGTLAQLQRRQLALWPRPKRLHRQHCSSNIKTSQSL